MRKTKIKTAAQLLGSRGGKARAKNLSEKELSEWGKNAGAKGGKKRATRYSREQLSKWAKLGGRPKGSKNNPKKGKAAK
jgi:hypothetical protein